MNILENDIVKINRLAEAAASVIFEVSPLTEEVKPLAKNQMRIELDMDDTEGFTQIYSGLDNDADIYGSQRVIYSSGPLSFIDIIRDDFKFKTDDKKEQAIVKLKKEQAYVPGSLKITRKGTYKIYNFKIKDKFLEPSLLKNIKISYSY